jgi:glycosyltransferase involved in cell wall biosynthesis
MLSLRAASVPPVLIPTLRREITPIGDARALADLVQIMRRFRPDIVHTHLAKAGMLGRLAARMVGVPIILHTFHGNVLRGYFGTTRSRVFLTIERLMARLSTRVIAISPQQRSEIADLGIAGLEKIVEIPLGLDLAPFLQGSPGSLRAELGIPPQCPIVGTVARLVPIKGIDVFLSAAAAVARRRPDVRFVVVGDGELRANLERLAAGLGIADRVRFTGWRADLPGIYADLDVFVLCSHNEGTPVSIIEAMASGRAVVATAVGGVIDLLRDGGGILAPDGGSDDIANAIIVLLGDAERRRALTEVGRRRVYPTYDASSLVAHIDTLYSELIGAVFR